MENVITLGKVIGLLLFCPPSSLFFFVENSHNELARPVLRNIFLVGRAKRDPPPPLIIGRAKRAPHWGVQSRFCVIYIYMYICACVCRGPKSVGGIMWAKRAHAQSQYWAVKSDK